MPWFDYDEIEEELDLVVPAVFRLFMDTAEAHGFPLAAFELYDNTRALIDGNWQMRLNGEEWKDYYLALGTNDGCGNYELYHGSIRGRRRSLFDVTRPTRN